MRVFLCAALAMLLAFAPVAARADDKALSATKRQTFVVQSCPQSGKATIGSGVVVARSRDTLTIATAAHAIVPAQTLRILDITRQAYYEILGTRVLHEYDIALIRVRAQMHFHISPVIIAEAESNEPVWVWGHPPDAFWVVATGSVIDTHAQIPGREGIPRITIACATCTHGDSGSGVFDARGRLLGILTHGWTDATGSPLFLEVEPATLLQQELLAAS